MTNDNELKRAREYERYNLLSWIVKWAPESVPAKDALERAATANPEFMPREHPDLDAWTSEAGLVIHTSPKSAKELLMESPESSLEVLLEFEGDRFHNAPDRDGLLQELGKASASSFDWSFRLARLLVKGQIWKKDLWHHLVNGWEQSVLSAVEWREAIKLLQLATELHTTVDAVPRLLQNSLQKSSGGLPDDVLTEAEHLSDRIWESLQDMPLLDKDMMGWLGTAINHPSGYVAEFWLHALFRRKKAAGENWSGLSEEYRDRFARVINGGSFSARMGAVILVSRIHFLADVDFPWARDQLLPLMDFSVEEQQAERAWHGFLYWGKSTPTLVPLLKPLFKQAVSKLADDGERLRQTLFERIAHIVLNDPGNPLDDDWLYDILGNEHTAPDDRGTIATEILHAIRNTTDEVKKSVWERWLRQYWNDRVDGVPVRLEEREAKALIESTPYLKPVYTESVDLVCRAQILDLEHTLLFHHLLEHKLVDHDPEATLKLLVYVLDDGKDQTLHCFDLVPLHRELVSKLGEDQVTKLTELLLQKGCL